MDSHLHHGDVQIDVLAAEEQGSLGQENGDVVGPPFVGGRSYVGTDEHRLHPEDVLLAANPFQRQDKNKIIARFSHSSTKGTTSSGSSGLERVSIPRYICMRRDRKRLRVVAI